LTCLAAVPVAAQESSDSLSEANNPLASFTTVAMQNYYTPELTELPDSTANTFWLRYAKPMGNWIVRASLPVSHVPISALASESGVGDLNAFAARIIDIGRPGVTFGVGPQLTLDTASEDATGTGKTQAGLAAVYFDGSSPTFQWGGLVTWQMDISGSSNRPDTDLLAVQPFYFLQLGNGYYFRGAPTWVFNREADTYNVPIGAGLGRVIPTDNAIFNIYLEPQYTVLSKGAGQPKLQIIAGFNIQFE
jgi:hypothetical protein